MNDLAEITAFAKRYAKAWCNQNPEGVAAFFAENGSLTVNDGPPAVGRVAIAEIARGFMRDFPDMIVNMDKVTHESRDGGRSSDASPARTDAVFHWTLTGTNTGPDGTGKCVRISGYELWKIDNDGLIGESKGHFDSAEYERQLKEGSDE
jgi:predicted ester cyclase